MTTKNTISIIAACVIVILLVAWLRPPEAQNVASRGGALGDHITEITGETLPRAIREARERGRSRVKVSDPMGNVIIADITQPTMTVFWTSDAGDVDVLEQLKAFNVPVERFHSVVRGEDGSLGFAINEVRSGEIASIIYEISVRVFNIPSTMDWTIDIE